MFCDEEVLALTQCAEWGRDICFFRKNVIVDVDESDCRDVREEVEVTTVCRVTT